MDGVPAELWAKIAKLACTDGGFTGCSLSLVSRYMRAVVQPVRFYSVSICGRRRASIFAQLLETQNPFIRHLRIRFCESQIHRRFDDMNPPYDNAPEETLACIIRHASATVYTLFWYSVVHNHVYLDILSNLAFPVLRDLSVPCIELWRPLRVSAPFPSLRRLHIYDSMGGTNWQWKTIAQLAPSISAIRIPPIFRGIDLPQVLRALLHIPEDDLPKDSTPTWWLLSSTKKYIWSYPRGSAEEREVATLTSRLSSLKRVIVQEQTIDPTTDDGIYNDEEEDQLSALHALARACANRDVTEGKLHFYPPADVYGRRAARADWLDVVEGGEGPWSETPGEDALPGILKVK